jgi:hypothetical protein
LPQAALARSVCFAHDVLQTHLVIAHPCRHVHQVVWLSRWLHRRQQAADRVPAAALPGTPVCDQHGAWRRAADHQRDQADAGRRWHRQGRAQDQAAEGQQQLLQVGPLHARGGCLRLWDVAAGGGRGLVYVVEKQSCLHRMVVMRGGMWDMWDLRVHWCYLLVLAAAASISVRSRRLQDMLSMLPPSLGGYMPAYV